MRLNARIGLPEAAHGQEIQEGLSPCQPKLPGHGAHPSQPDTAPRPLSSVAGRYSAMSDIM
eukprot:1159633-Pelagomonas_calceolata.AAC.6